MKKIIKISIYAAIIFIVLMVGTVFALRMMYPPEKLKKIAQNKAVQYLRRQIDFKKISIGLGGLKMDDFAMSERPTFDRGIMVRAGCVSIMPKILPLFKGKVEIGTIKGQDINANLTRHKDGTFNFSDFMQASEAKKTAAKKTKKKTKQLDLVIGKFILENSGIKFTDNMLGSTAEISGLGLKAKNISLKQTFELYVSLTADYKTSRISANIPLEAKALVNLSKPTEEMAKIKMLEIKNAKATLKAKDSDIEISKMNIETHDASLKEPFEVSVALTTIYKLDSKITTNITSRLLVEPKGIKPEKANLKILSLTADMDNISTNVKGEVSNLTEPKANLEITVLPFNTSEIAKYIKDFKYKFEMPKTIIDTKFKASAKMINISSLKIKPRQSSITGNGVLLNKNDKWQIFKGAVGFDLKLADFAASASDLKKYALGGIITGKMACNLVKNKLKYNGDMTLADIKAEYEKNTLSALNGYIKIATNELRSSNITGKLNNSDFKTSIFAGMYDTKTKVNLNTFIDTVNLDLMLPEKNPAQKQKTKDTKTGKSQYQNIKPLDLKMSVKVNKITHPNFTGNNAGINCNLTNMTPKFDKVSGTADFTVKNGQMKDLTVIAKRHNMAKALLVPLTTLQKISKKLQKNILPDFDNIQYSVIEGSYKFTNGYMNIIKSQMFSSAADTTASGIANFKTDRLNMKIHTKVKAGRGVPLNFTVTGKIADPSVKLDVIKTLFGSKKNGEEKKNVVEEGKKLLQSLF